jgi:hypothetical protein
MRGRRIRHKYGAIPTMVDGIKFASKREANRYRELRLLERAGEIHELTLQPVFPLTAGEGITVGKYLGDFRYYTREGELVVEDVKGMRTPVYRLKKRIVEACYGIQIREI